MLQAMRLKATGPTPVGWCFFSARLCVGGLRGSTVEAELVAGLDTVVALQSAEAMLSDIA